MCLRMWCYRTPTLAHFKPCSIPSAIIFEPVFAWQRVKWSSQSVRAGQRHQCRLFCRWWIMMPVFSEVTRGRFPRGCWRGDGNDWWAMMGLCVDCRDDDECRHSVTLYRTFASFERNSADSHTRVVRYVPPKRKRENDERKIKWKMSNRYSTYKMWCYRTQPKIFIYIVCYVEGTCGV